MSYEIIKSMGTEATGRVTRESTLVKIDPTYVRANLTTDLYEIDHVIVEALRISDSGVVYEETHVVASDEDGVIHPAILYLAGRALTVPEALFAIGENNYDPIIETDADHEFENGSE